MEPSKKIEIKPGETKGINLKDNERCEIIAASEEKKNRVIQRREGYSVIFENQNDSPVSVFVFDK